MESPVGFLNNRAKVTKLAEETKINFFEGQLESRYELEEKPEEDQILETKIDPLEWK